MIFAAIVAGGTGSRMGADRPKQFLELAGTPVIIHTIGRFMHHAEVDMVYVGVHAEWADELERMCLDAGFDMKKISILTGGVTRDDTVRRMIDRITQEYEISDSDIILTHDGVRPFVSDTEISESIKAMQTCDGATLCLPSTDTLLYSENGRSIDSVADRSKLFRALTPQTFLLSSLISAYKSLTAEQLEKVTDTASVFTLAGKPVSLIIGSASNIKLTTPEDMRLAEMMIKEKDDG